MIETKFEKEITCDNCNERRTYRFPRGTDLRGKRIECSNCGVLIAASNVKPDEVKREQEPWAFMRDFFGLTKKRGLR